MRRQIAIHRMCWEKAPAADLRDRRAFLNSLHSLNTPDQMAELHAITSILKSRTKRHHAH